MKTVTEIVGGAQGLLDISFDLQSCFEEKLNERQKTFLHMLRCIESHMPPLYRPYAGTGRKPYHYLPFFRSHLAKLFFQIATTTMLIERLKADPNVRLLCGFAVIPGPARFSRAYRYLAETNMITGTHERLSKETFKDKVVYHMCRDSTAISARETVPKKPVQTVEKRFLTRGRRPKTAKKREKQPTVMETQLPEAPSVSLEKLDKPCAFGCKKNSRGNITYWKGYKLHLDVSDSGFPVTAVVTGANVQDSSLAIPMEKLTEQRITFCYTLMDAGYDAQRLRAFIENRGRVPIIDYKTRRNGERPVLDPARQERYKIRTAVERANSHLKDALIPKAIYVKGHTKVSFVLLAAVLCLAALKHFQFLC